MTNLAPGDPRHGQLAGSSAGCDCLPCRLARSRYKIRRERLQAYGRWQPFVNAEPARQHLRRLSSDHGIGWQTAAALAGLPEATVSGLLYVRGRRKSGPARRCRQSTLDAILAVQPTLDQLPDRALVPAVGTLRRLRALVAAGHPMLELGERLPGHPEHTRRSIRDGVDSVTAHTARSVRALYDELSTQPVPDTWVARRARALATSKGWAPPYSWDDDVLDLPDGQPSIVTAGSPDEPLVDLVAVERALRGHQVRLTRLEKHHAVHTGRAAGMSLQDMADALRMSYGSVRHLASSPPPPVNEVAA